MPKEEWGTKRLCPVTGKRFYDLNRSPVVSPYTGEVVDIETGRGRMIAADAEERTSARSRSSDDDSVLEDDDVDVDLEDEVLEEDDDGNVSLDDIADMGSDDDEA